MKILQQLWSCPKKFQARIDMQNVYDVYLKAGVCQERPCGYFRHRSFNI